jgi:2-hydroxy-6-oxonona-2,4-dienedioate hydrolase
VRTSRREFSKCGRRRRFCLDRLFFGLAFLLLVSVAVHARAELTTSGEVAGLTAQFGDINGIRTRYYEIGQGEPLVLVHGGGWSGHASANVWSKDIPLFAKGFHVFAPDKIGSGMTDNPADDNDFNIQGEVDHIYDFIRAMKAGMVHLIGEGRGGDCVFFLALQHPEVVRDVVLVDTNIAGPEPPSGNALANCPQQPDDEAWKCRTRALSSSPNDAFDDEYFMAGKYMSLLPKRAETAEKLKGGAGGELATPDGFNRWKAEWFDRIRKEGVLEMPVLIYWGQHDISAPVTNGQALRDLIAVNNPHVQMIIAAQAGHFPFREQPERFVSDVTNFILWAVHADSTQSNAGAPVEDR